MVIKPAASRRIPCGDLKTMWGCKCDCGNSVTVDASKLIQGSTRSCGCLREEILQFRLIEHGMSGTKEHRAWSHMLGRCYDKNDPSYRNYGARGVTVCRSWRGSFKNFVADIGLAPNESLSLERKNNRGNYTPSNCVWATRLVQSNNRRNNVIVHIHGLDRMTLSQCARHFRVCYKSLHNLHRTKNIPILEAIKRCPLSKINPPLDAD